jgi:hypothetical protein
MPKGVTVKELAGHALELAELIAEERFGVLIAGRDAVDFEAVAGVQHQALADFALCSQGSLKRFDFCRGECQTLTHFERRLVMRTSPYKQRL